MRENLLERMIKIYGFEHPIVLMFAEMCENLPKNSWNEKYLEIMVTSHEKFPMVEEIDD